MSNGVNERFDFSAALPRVEDLTRAHFIAIGGSGMSGIARLMRARGIEVSGSDNAESAAVDKLRSEGIAVTIGNRAENIDPLPDGTVLARLAWSYDALPESAAAFGKPQSHVAGHPKNGVQFMVKDSVKYASTGGWGYAEFDSGKAAGNPQACFACHTVVKDRDYVFNRLAPVDTGGIGQ